MRRAWTPLTVLELRRVAERQRFELEEQGAGWYIRDTVTGELVSTDPIHKHPLAELGVKR
jgi:hypothetical protein